MKLTTLIKKDVQRRIGAFAAKYVVIFTVLALLFPLLSFVMGDSFEYDDFAGAVGFIFPILLPILSVYFLIEDQGTRISDFFFKTGQGRRNYLFSLLISGLALGLLADLLLVFFAGIFQVALQVTIPWNQVLLDLATYYLLCSLFYLSLALLCYLFVRFAGVTLITITILLVILLPILISIAAAQIGLNVLYETPFYLLSFLGINAVTPTNLLYSAVIILILYAISFWRIQTIDF